MMKHRVIHPPQAHAQSRRERGVAIISALLVVALSAILVAGILWRQQVQIRRIENQRLVNQSEWVARGTIDWARLVLRSGADTSPVDYLGGVWAVPIAETRLSDLLGKFGGGSGGDLEGTNDSWVSGSIEDAQAKFNLRNMAMSTASTGAAIDPVQVKAFQKLLASLGLNGELAGPASQYVRRSLQYSIGRTRQSVSNSLSSMTSIQGVPNVPQPGGADGQFTDKPGLADSDDDSSARPLPITSVYSLLDVPGFTPAVVARLAPFVTVLPTVTPINVNTASAEVISALIPELSLSNAQGLVNQRDQVFFISVGDFQTRVGAMLPPNFTIDTSDIDVKTSYFILHGQIRRGRAQLHRDALIYRDTLTHATRVVSVDDAN
ncbi:general secretion pathway protein K [Pararobbsia alpina]|uniref:type II secretion system minor pseudopilin GspK n=1 Tax=Pararobbsia alpina TaxID=621374 RepID=UPI0039A4C76E